MQEAVTRETIREIARVLKGTPSTVSRALQGHYVISSFTKGAVHKIVKKIKYHLNKIASSLRHGKSKNHWCSYNRLAKN